MNARLARCRGIVLTQQGVDRLEDAITFAQEHEKFGSRFTQTELSERVKLSIKTIKKIREGKIPTDEASVRTLFGAFDLELESADYGQPESSPSTPDAHLPSSNFFSMPKNDWGEKPDTALFFGRTEELATLNQWVQGDQCRLITLLGMGGIGKTSLAAKLANQVYDRFDYVIWRSLREAPPLDEILVRLIQFLSDQQETEINLPTRLGERIIRLLHYLREHRCLVVLDNLESILQAETAGHYRDGYEGYGELIQRIGSSEHQSCLLLTSRECPRELALLAGDLTPVRLWSVGSIDTEAGREILKTKGLALDEADDQGQELIRRCSGNPQALHLVATAIQREFLGDVDDFLQEQVTAVEDVRSLLDQHMIRLAPLERSVLFWLAINREPVGLDELMEDLLPPVTKQEVRGALRGLSDRYLIEAVGKQFTLQNVIMEFATDRFVEKVIKELHTQKFNLFHTHALIKATAKTYIRETQVRMILQSTAEQIDDLQQQVSRSLQTIRQHSDWPDGYAPGNLLNLQCQTKIEISYKNFSTLTLRQIYLKRVATIDLNLSNSKLIKPILTETFSSIQTVNISPEGNFLAAGDRKGCIQIWLLRSQEHLATFREHTNDVSSLIFSPTHQILASGSEDCKIRLWDIHQRQCLHIFDEHDNWVRSVTFSPDGKFLASGSDDLTIRLWDVQRRQCLHVFTGHTHFVCTVAFSPDGRFLASGSDDLTIRLWDVQRRQCLHVFTGHTHFVCTVAFSPDGRFLASGSSDSTIRLWDIQNRQLIHVFSDHTNTVWSVAFSPDGKLLASGSSDSTIRLWDIQNRQCLQTFSGHTHLVWSVTFSPDGKSLVSGSGDSTIRLWDVQKRKCMQVFSGYTNRICSVVFSLDSCFLASGSEDFMVRLWDIQTKKCIHVLQGHTGYVRSVVFSPDSQLLASGSEDATIRIWDVQKRECLHIFEGHTDWIRSVVFSPDNQFLASGGRDSEIRIWDIKRRQCLHIFTGHISRVWSLAFSPNSQFIVSGLEDSTIRFWNIQSRQFHHVFEGHTDWVRSIAFSPDGKFLVSGSSDSTIRLWDIHQQKCLHVFTGHSNRVWSVVFSPDGKTIASGSYDGTIRLWNIKEQRCLHVFAKNSSWNESIAFSPDGQILANGGADGMIYLWDVLTGHRLAVLQVPRPYEGTNITGVQGLTEAQRVSMITLGAVDYSSENSTIE